MEFKTYKDAMDFCAKFGYRSGIKCEQRIPDYFNIAKALQKAYKEGERNASQHTTTADKVNNI